MNPPSVFMGSMCTRTGKNNVTMLYDASKFHHGGTKLTFHCIMEEMDHKLVDVSR